MSMICLKCGASNATEASSCHACGGPVVPLRSSQGDALQGRVLAEKYVLLERLGAGGFGAVYKARHLVLNRTVAVKVLGLDLSQHPDALRRFYTEAQNTSQLSHPNNIKVFDFGHTDDGILFLAMELVEGVQLSRLPMPLPIPRTLFIARQIAAALGEAHDLGIVHRDLKPDNVMVSRVDGQDFIRVLDYGIAKLENSDTGLTSTGAFIGTPAYTSPEQISGHTLDRRCDIYTLGLILYELAVGEPPFLGAEPIAVIFQHRTAAPVPPAQRVGMPAELDRLILDCLSKAPGDRPSNMAEVRRRIDSILATDYPRVSPAVDDTVATRERVFQITTSPPPAGRVGAASGGTVHDVAAQNTQVRTRRPNRARWAVAAALLIVGAGAIVLALALRPPSAPLPPSAEPGSVQATPPTAPSAPSPTVAPAQPPATVAADVPAAPAPTNLPPAPTAVAPAVAPTVADVPDAPIPTPTPTTAPREAAPSETADGDAPQSDPHSETPEVAGDSSRDALRRRLAAPDEPAPDAPAPEADEQSERRRQLEERLRNAPQP